MLKLMLPGLNIQLACIVTLTAIRNNIDFCCFVLNLFMLSLCMTIHIVTALLCEVSMLTYFLFIL